MKLIENLQKKAHILYYFFSPSPKILAILTFLTLLYGFVEMVAIGAIFPVLEAGIEGMSTQKLNAIALLSVKTWYLRTGLDLNLNYLTLSSIILIILTIFSFFYKIFYAFFSQKILAYLWLYQQERIFSVLCIAEYSFYTNEKQGRIIYNSAVASESIAAVIDSFIRGLSETVKGLFLIALLFISSWYITLVIVVIGSIYIFFSQIIIQKMVNKPSAQILTLKQKQHQNLNEFLTGIKLIKVFNKTNFWKNQYIHLAKSVAQLLIKIQLGSLFPSFILQMAIGIAIGLGGIYMSNHHGQTFLSFIPLLGLFAISFSRISGAISSAITYFAAIARHFPNLIASYDLIHKTPVIQDKNESLNNFFFNRTITFNDVSFCYSGSSHNVINNISFVISKNTTVALVGGSGGGKTTILNLFLRLFDNHSGKIYIDDVDICAISRESYYAALGFVSQEPFLFNGTILENVAFGSSTSIEEIQSACKKADANEFIEKLPLNYQCIVGDSGLKLSGGQKQRIGIARALLKQPEILILDEPTSSLDNESERRIQKTLEKLSKSMTIIIIAHRLSTIQNADKIIVLKDGRIAGEGTHENLINSNVYYSELYNQAQNHKT